MLKRVTAALIVAALVASTAPAQPSLQAKTFEIMRTETRSQPTGAREPICRGAPSKCLIARGG